MQCNMQMDEATILKIAFEIKIYHGSKDQKMHYFSSKYPDFAKAYPTLFSACMDPLFKLEYLKMMLHKRKDIHAGRTTLDQADADVYGTLQQRYIHPLLNASSSNLEHHPTHSQQEGGGACTSDAGSCDNAK